MVRDDYHVIVYQILSYLYQCLKKVLSLIVRTLNTTVSTFKSIKITGCTYYTICNA